MQRDTFRPDNMSDSEWKELKQELEERNIDNKNHTTTQLKTKKILLYTSPVIMGVMILLGYFVFTQFTEIVYTIGTVILVLIALYIVAIEDFAPDD